MVPVYYHLLWINDNPWTLEKLRFEKGQKYMVFLRHHQVDDGKRLHVEYELTDRWLSVIPDHLELTKAVKGLVTKPQR